VESKEAQAVVSPVLAVICQEDLVFGPHCRFATKSSDFDPELGLRVFNVGAADCPAEKWGKNLSMDQRCHALAPYWQNGLHRFPPTYGRKSVAKCPESMDLWHLKCCQFAVLFDKLIPHVTIHSLGGLDVLPESAKM
jgi:hypothetical protein